MRFAAIFMASNATVFYIFHLPLQKQDVNLATVCRTPTKFVPSEKKIHWTIEIRPHAACEHLRLAENIERPTD